MNCAYHLTNVAVVNCNGCGKPLCPACDHRIKGFPFCQDCIVSGVELLRNRSHSSYVPLVKKQTSPLVAAILSLICPGLGAAYNGQTSKALIYFAVFVGLFQMAVLTSGTGAVIFVFGFMGMWLFAAIDSWRTAQLVRSGLTPNGAEDIIVQRISGNPKLWGVVLTVLGAMFFLQAFVNVRFLLRGILPFLLVGLGIYLMRGYIVRKGRGRNRSDFDGGQISSFGGSLGETNFRTGEFDADYNKQNQSGGWKTR